jgi:hypothetical protein
MTESGIIKPQKVQLTPKLAVFMYLLLLVLFQKYCTILINSSVMGHRGYLICWNMGAVMGHKGFWWKVRNCDTYHWQFWHCGSKQVNLALAAYCCCIFYVKLTQIMSKYPATLQPLMKSGSSQAKWWNENFVRCVTISYWCKSIEIVLLLPPAHTAHSLTQCIITAQTFSLSS